MTSQIFANIRKLTHKIHSEEELNYIGESGSVLTSKFYHDVNRGRVRHLIKINGTEFGFVDFVTPYNIFKDPYEFYVLNYSTQKPFDFEGIEWEEEFYPPPTGIWYMPTTFDIEAAIRFFDFVTKS